MVLVDTSVWIFHFRQGSDELAGLLNDGNVLNHPFIVGELACGNLKDRGAILSYLNLLPMGIVAGHHEVVSFIEMKQLMGKGLGYVDLHLLASTVLTGVSIWTLDEKLAKAAQDLGIKYG